MAVISSMDVFVLLLFFNARNDAHRKHNALSAVSNDSLRNDDALGPQLAIFTALSLSLCYFYCLPVGSAALLASALLAPGASGNLRGRVIVMVQPCPMSALACSTLGGDRMQSIKAFLDNPARKLCMIGPDQTVWDALELMAAHNIGAMPVVD